MKMANMLIEYSDGSYGFPPIGGLSNCNENNKTRPPEYIYYVIVKDKEYGRYIIVESTFKDDYIQISAHETVELAERAIKKLENK